jgi:hypothetical protein
MSIIAFGNCCDDGDPPVEEFEVECEVQMWWVYGEEGTQLQQVFTSPGLAEGKWLLEMEVISPATWEVNNLNGFNGFSSDVYENHAPVYLSMTGPIEGGGFDRAWVEHVGLSGVDGDPSKTATLLGFVKEVEVDTPLYNCTYFGQGLAPITASVWTQPVFKPPRSYYDRAYWAATGVPEKVIVRFAGRRISEAP